MTTQQEAPAVDPAAPLDPAAEHAPRRTSLVVGLVLLVVGAVLVAWTGWQFWGTTWVGHRTQADVVQRLEQQWDAPGGQAEVRTDHGLAGAVVRIPRFGADYAVPVLEGVEPEELSAGFGHFTDSALPGEEGNFALAAHRVTHGEPLRDMPRLQVGDRVVVETRGSVFTYELTSGGADLTVPFTEGWVVGAQPVNPDPTGVTPLVGPGSRLLTLTTCSELFHTDDRSIAFGTLVSAEPRT